MKLGDSRLENIICFHEQLFNIAMTKEPFNCCLLSPIPMSPIGVPFRHLVAQDRQKIKAPLI
jgi:hypothetical protein